MQGTFLFAAGPSFRGCLEDKSGQELAKRSVRQLRQVHAIDRTSTSGPWSIDLGRGPIECQNSGTIRSMYCLLHGETWLIRFLVSLL